MNQYGIQTKAFGFGAMPVLFDEWAHVACYCNATVMEDPNIRDFWGRSLDKMWDRVFQSDGGLGGAVWGMIDETFMLPDTLPGYTDWWGTDRHADRRRADGYADWWGTDRYADRG